MAGTRSGAGLTGDVRALIVLLAVSGIGHFVRPGPFEQIVPQLLPHKRALVYTSGIAEVACAAALARAETRRLGGLATAALMVAVFPANVQMAVTANADDRSTKAYRFGTVARLPLQLPLVVTALKAARQASPPPGARRR